jgi:two-component system response regulator AtoC
MDDTMPRILLIEDDDSSRELGQFNLTRAGYEVDTAPDGDQGLRRFTSGRYDLVITDLRMPGRSGMEVLAEVKRAEPDVQGDRVLTWHDFDGKGG